MDLSQNCSLNTVIFPEIVIKNYQVNNENWKIYYYDKFTSIFENKDGSLNEKVCEEFAPYVSGKFSDFRHQLSLKSISFLVGFFSKKQEIRIYSQRLNYELFLLHESEGLSDEEKGERYLTFKSHVEMCSTLIPAKFASVIDVITQNNSLPDLVYDAKYDKLEKEVQKIINILIGKVNEYRPSLFERFTDWGLSLTASFALLRIHLLKFLAILPSLDFDTKGVEVKRILIEALRRLFDDSVKAKNMKKKGQESPIPAYVFVICKVVYLKSLIIPAKVLTYCVRKSVRIMARRFIAGETIETANKSLSNLFNTSRDVTLDQLGELVVSEKEADHYCSEVLKLIKGFSLHVKKGEKNAAGINRAHVSIKVSALCSDFKSYAPEYTYDLVAPRLKKILIAAKEEDVFINVDSEHYDYRDIVFQVYKRVLLETPELKEFTQTGIVLQAYLRDAAAHLDEILELAKERKQCMAVRIVKGAYWDAETVEADALSFDAPQFLNKEETDLHFRQLIVKILSSYPHLQLVVASHNFADHSFSEAVRNEYHKDTPIIEHQCLDMTYEALSTGMAKMGWPVRNYVPVGSLLVGMAYLVRRIMENSSQVGVLTIMRSHKSPKSILSPQKVHQVKKENGELVRDMTSAQLTSHFFNIAPVRLYLENERKWVVSEFEKFNREKLGIIYENPFGLNGDFKEMVSSSDPNTIIGKIKMGKADDVNYAVDAASNAYNSGKWSKTKPIYRASVLLRASTIMMAQRNSLSSLISYEAGKTFPEALADVDEAIDFLNFYAREEVKINKTNSSLISRGVMAVISPWNFPIAIPCGMTVSALVAGNSVILKSASQTSLIAQKMVDILHESGVPIDVLIHTVGSGSVVGNALIENELIAGIVFTGSKEVGMSIAHKIGKRIVKNKLFNVSYPTKVITEMGGKNAIIVTANAELDETVSGILYSSFGHAGQKCSATSRVLVDNRVKERLIERIREAGKDLQVGEAYKFSTTINPVITMRDKTRLQNEVNEAVQEALSHGGNVILDRTKEEFPGYCVGPAIIELPSHRALKTSSYAVKELFGPVVHIIGFDELDEAIEIFNGTEYALTGGIFSQSQDDIEYLLSKLESGNLYVNRTTTGARVSIEPFGGFKLSGTGPKAGGADYVPVFHVNTKHSDASVIDMKNERGSDYQFYLCRPQTNKIEERVQFLDKSLEEIVNHFESLFVGNYGEDKDILLEFKSWMKHNLISYQTGEHPNRIIPGQLSYNSLSKVQEHVVILSYTDKPMFLSLINFIAAVSVGSGVTIIAKNRKAFEWWNGVKAYFHNSGFEKKNIDVFMPTDELVTKTLKEPYLSSIIVDGDHRRLQKTLDKIYDGACIEKRMRNVISIYDAEDILNFKKLLEQFVWVRSMAVNTMRHGAPLNLEL